MQSQAVVLAVKNRKAVILASGGIYEEIPDRAYFVGQKIAWERKQRDAVSMLRRGLMIAACLVLLLSSSGLVAAKYLPWTVVSVAYGEASVQYRLNAWNEVLSSEAVTEDGQALLDEVHTASHESIEAVMERTFAVLGQEDRDTAVSVEIASRIVDGKRAEEAVADAGQAADMPVTLERVPWQQAGKPGSPDAQMPTKNDLPPAQPEALPQPDPAGQDTPERDQPLSETPPAESYVPEAEQPHPMSEQSPEQKKEERPLASFPDEQVQPFAAGPDQKQATEEAKPLVMAPPAETLMEGLQEDHMMVPLEEPQGEEQTPAQNSLPSTMEHGGEVQPPPFLNSDNQHSEPSETFPGEPMPASTGTGENETPAKQPSVPLQENMDRMTREEPSQVLNQFNGQEALPSMP